MNPAAPVTTYLTVWPSSGDHPIDLAVADDEETPLHGDDRRVLAVRVRPEEPSGARGEGVGATREGRDVPDAAEHGARGGAWPTGIQAPGQRGMCGVQRA